jgi:stage II sporulation protein M
MAGFGFKINSMIKNPIRSGKGLSAGLPVKWIFAVGIFAGIILMNIEKSTLLENTDLLDEDTFSGMKFMTVDSSALFYYALKKRMGSAVLLTILSTTYLGLPVCFMFVLWQGMLLGGFVSLFIIRYGIKGAILAMISLFPQYLVYIPAFYALVHLCEAMNRKIYFSKYTERYTNKNNRLANFTKFIVVFSAIFIGCILESFINSKLFIEYLKIF